MNDPAATRTLIRAALSRLGIDRLVLTVHDATFPDLPDEDIGRGSPASRGAEALLAYAADCGFDAVQLGPQGTCSEVNPSPYDGALFSRSPRSISLGALVREGLLGASILEAAVAGRPAGAERRVDRTYARRAHEDALRAAYGAFLRRQNAAELLEAFTKRQGDWLERASTFEVLTGLYRTDDWTRWTDTPHSRLDQRLFCPLPNEQDACRRRRAQIAAEHAGELGFHVFCQWLAHHQHEAMRKRAAAMGLRVFGDLQIGIPHRDAWWARPLFLRGYCMGAPPSRTNPLGQPWQYPVLDPAQYHAAAVGSADAAGQTHTLGPALQFLRGRLSKLFDEYDGLRIDHPHGLVCPWVYRPAQGDLHAAVQAGGRLFESPDLPDHPDLARYALVRREQLAPPDLPRYADDWVRWLEAEQVERYAVAIDLLLEVARERGRGTQDIPCEVLSTCPVPLAQVLARHGLGRFRVTQKADPADPDDPYRSETAQPGDWIMVGTHDTPPLAHVVSSWSTPLREEWAAYLARRLNPQSQLHSATASQLAQGLRALSRALFADLFVGPARHVKVFFTDWLGMHEIYNRPGTIDPDNWTLRVPPDYRAFHARQCEEGLALDVPDALATALRARAGAAGGDTADLAAALQQRARPGSA